MGGWNNATGHATLWNGHTCAAIALASAALVAGCATVGTPAPSPADRGNEASLLTRYTLSQCLAAAYPDTRIERDARASAAGYLEFGSLPIEAYEDATAVARDAASRRYEGKQGESLHVMKCLDLLHGPELERLFDRHLR